MQKNSWLVILLSVLSLSASAQKVNYTVDGDTLIHLSQFLISLTPLGFPQQITSTSPVMKDANGVGTNVMLAENIHFHLVRQSDGKDIRLKAGGVAFTRKRKHELSWRASGEAPEIRMEMDGRMDKRGVITCKVRFMALEELDMKDIVMHIPFDKASANFVEGLGMGSKWNYNPDSIFHWKWNMSRADQNRLFIGSLNMVLGYVLLSPSSWDNETKGGIDIGNKGKSMLVSSYSGPRHLQKGDSVVYGFSLVINPPLSLERITNH